MAWFGWTSISQAQVYTKAASRKLTAREAGKLITGTGVGSPADPVAIMHHKLLKILEFGNDMAIPAGFEPATHGVEIRYSIQLSYGTGWAVISSSVWLGQTG